MKEKTKTKNKESRNLCEESQMNEELTRKLTSSNQASVCSLKMSQFESEIQKLLLKFQILLASEHVMSLQRRNFPTCVETWDLYIRYASFTRNWQKTWTKNWREPLPAKRRFSAVRKKFKKVGWQLCRLKERSRWFITGKWGLRLSPTSSLSQGALLLPLLH